MAAQNIVDLPPCRPGMADTHRRATNAFRAHWRAHGTAQPQKLVLTRAQADDLLLCRLYGCVPMNGVKPEQGKFNGSPIEVSDATAGVLVAHDGTEMPLADFDQLAHA
ncbi:hypothetical protein AE621_23295 [Acidovorax sp. SD340]|nr:hypothetical protein AE621_23295 [Acidovorax sp. SD340]